MDRQVLVKMPRAMKAQLDRLRTHNDINVSAFIRHAIAKALKRPA